MAQGSIDVRGLPELIFDMRRELANMVRSAAEDEAPAVAVRLREVATLFETGQTEDCH